MICSGCGSLSSLRLVSAQHSAALSCYDWRVSKTIITLDQRLSVTFPPEALDALGVEAGAELEVEIIGRALIVRSVEEASRSREFLDAFGATLFRRRLGYEEVQKSPKRSRLTDYAKTEEG